MIFFIHSDIRAHDAERRRFVFNRAVLPQAGVFSAADPVLVVGHVKRFLDFRIADLDDAVRIRVVVADIPKQVPGCLPDPVRHGVVGGAGVFGVVFDFVFFDQFFKCRRETSGQKIVFVHESAGSGTFQYFPESIGCCHRVFPLVLMMIRKYLFLFPRSSCQFAAFSRDTMRSGADLAS